MKPSGITRVRNEALIIADTIQHYLERCEHIFMYDDCSEDATVSIAKEVGRDRITIIEGDFWITNRLAEETRHRGLLLDMARKSGAEWVYCFDADERLVGSLPDNPPVGCSGYRLRLFDGYLTRSHQLPYISGNLAELPRMFGPECRDILTLFHVDAAWYEGLDRREPLISGDTLLADTKIKHYGKCISVEQWEATCEYYATYFPKKYKKKWESRRGHAIHKCSDFGRALFDWESLMINRHQWVKL